MSEKSLKLTAYFGERQRALGNPRRFLADEMLDLFGARSVATSVMMRGVASFGPTGGLHSDVSLSLSEDPPVTIVAVDVESKIRGLVNDVTEITGHGLVTLERARLITRDSGTDALSEIDSRTGDAAKLTIYVGRQVRVAARRPTWPSVRCCTATDSPEPQYFSAWTAPRTVSASGPGSSAATSTCRR